MTCTARIDSLQARISDEQWDQYFRQGFLHLGQLVDADELRRLCARVDDLALGRVVNPQVQVQLDTGGRYEDLPDVTAQPAAGTLLYRKVQGLETDELFRSVLRGPVLAEVAAHHYGRHTSASLFRAMVMNKPAAQGTVLPWHQDGGDVWALDRDPLITIWMALDDATATNGCVEVIPGSHRLGLVSAQGSTLSAEDAQRFCPEDQVHPLEVPAGHAVLMHNWLIHRSGVNPTPMPRRAFTACYLDSRTRNILTGQHFPLILGPSTERSSTGYAAAGHGAPGLASTGPSHPYLDLLREEHAAQAASARSAAEYALSLKAENAVLQDSIASATEYARSLEAEVARLRAPSPAAATQPAGVAELASALAKAGLQRGRVLLRRFRSAEQ
ncbi:MAG: phytanoyl-CoA dioxygenase family protein [Jatrophihabitantaceae bacterium]